MTTRRTNFRAITISHIKNTSVLSTLWGLVITVVAVVCSSQPSTAYSQDQLSPAEWRTGKELDRYILAGFGASLFDAEFGPRIRAFAAQQRVAVFVDRRVDPSIKINLGVKNGTLEQFYWNVARDLDLGICRLGDVHYFGPKETADVLPLLWKQLTTVDAAARKQSTVPWTERERFKTDSPVQPKILLKQLAKQSAFKIENPEAIPHDVWRGIDLPPMTLERRVGILLVGFDKWYERSNDGTSVKIVELPTIDEGQLEFRNLKDGRASAKKLKSKFPNAKISSRETAITATASPSILGQIKAQLVSDFRFDSGGSSDTKVKTYSMTTEASRGSILASIANQTDRKFTYSRPIPDELREQIKFQVNDLTVEDLVKKVLDGTKLKAGISSTEIRISK